MEKSNLIILASLALATMFGIFGQRITYFMNENIASIGPIYYLTGLTFTSVLLYLVATVFTFVASKKKTLDKIEISIYYHIIGFIGILTSLWSLFVLAMWWG